MKARRIADLKIDEYEFRDWAPNTIGMMDQEDTAALIEAIKKAIKLAEKAQDQVFYGSTDSASNNLLQQIISDHCDYGWFGILHELMQSEMDISINRQLQSELAEFLSERQQTLIGKSQSTTKEKSKSEILGINKLYQEMGLKFDGLDASVFIPVFQHLFYEQELKDYDQALQWARDEAATGKHKSLAADLELALAIAKQNRQRQEEREKNSDQPVELPTRLKDFDHYQSQLMELLNSDDLQLPAKLGIASRLLAWDRALPVQGVWKCCEILTSAYDNQITVSEGAQATLLNTLNELSSESEFAKYAEAFANAWSKKHLRPSPRSQGHYYSSGWSEDSPAVGAIQLFTKLEKPAVVERIVRRFPSQMNQRGSLAVLIECGFHTRARKFCNRLWASPDELDFDDVGNYTKELDAALPEFVALFGNRCIEIVSRNVFCVAS